MNILIISPNAPPKNSAESMQVGRYLQELDKHHHITLVTTPVEKGWVRKDDSLDFKLSNADTLTLTLPLHNILVRLSASRYFKTIAIPDKDFWIRSKASWLIKRLHRLPDIIYSRSMPISAALLAREMKQRLNIPWIMHLSDPWSDNPYFTDHGYTNRLIAFEKSCFELANMIAVTTEGLAQYYRDKYPQLANKFTISPNVMPLNQQLINTREINSDELLLVYAGALYGHRRPTTILSALKLLSNFDQISFNRIKIQFVGNISEDIRKEIDTANLPQILVRDHQTYAEILEIQTKADIMISIEPDGSDPLLKTFLPSKMLDYISARKPIISITPENSESWKLCNRGYGWAIQPGDSQNLAKLLSDILTNRQDINVIHQLQPLPLPAEYSAAVCARQLIDLMENLVESQGPVID